jgi:hypothetical protein
MRAGKRHDPNDFAEASHASEVGTSSSQPDRPTKSYKRRMRDKRVKLKWQEILEGL